MQEQVGPRRHGMLHNGLGRIARVFAGLPFREIERRPAFFDIILYEPGYRRNIAVPGPDCLIAVTIKAGLPDQIARLRAVPGGFLQDRRVVMVAAIRDELRQGKRSDTGEHQQANNKQYPFEQRNQFNFHTPYNPQR